MKRYFAMRVVWSIAIVWAIVILNFLILQMVPGDPVQALIGEFPAPPEYIAKIRQDFGLDQPVHIRLGAYLWNLAQGNLGYSFHSRQPVLDVILNASGYTMLLMIPALLLSAPLGVALGLWGASRAGKPTDGIITMATLFGYSIPGFWLGQVLVLIFAILLGWLPASGFMSLRAPRDGLGQMLDVIAHMILPIVCIMSFKVAIFTRTARASILDVIHSDFILTARAKGLTRRFVLWVHVLPNAVIPIIAVFGYQFGHTLTSSLLLETVFAWPGIGNLFVAAISRRDFPVLQGILLFSTIFVVIANLLADFIYTLVDPRIRRSLGTRHV